MEHIPLPELAGKKIVSAKITRVNESHQEFSLEFSDETSFAFVCNSSVVSESTVYRGGVGEPEIIRSLTVT